jgi:hypothetical protein
MVKSLLWIYFLLATLISQIIMFNTLIAILGDTYGKITERAVFFAIKARTEMYADFMYQIKRMRFSKYLDNRYIYVIRPTEGDDGAAEWEGAVNELSAKIEKLKAKITDQNDKLFKSSENILVNNRSIQENIHEINEKIDNNMEKVERDQHEIKAQN